MAASPPPPPPHHIPAPLAPLLPPPPPRAAKIEGNSTASRQRVEPGTRDERNKESTRYRNPPDTNCQTFKHASATLTLGFLRTPCRWQVKLHLNTHTSLTQRSRNGLTMPLCRHSVGTNQETSSHATRHGTLGHSLLNSLSHCGLIQAYRVELVCAP